MEVDRDKYSEAIDKILTAINDLKVDIAKHSLCPRPGLCVDLNAAVSALSTRVTTIESQATRAGGIVSAAKYGLTLLTGGFGLWAIQKLFH